MSTSASKSPSSPTAYEFTKRKRWPDLLVYELSDAISFVLSDTDAKIWFCSRTITEHLAWSDAELIDRHFAELINSEDQRAFHVAFDESLRTRVEMNLFLRLKAKSHIAPQNIPQSEVLFEVKGYPYFVENEIVARCFFIVAKPYPSRNVAMLNTFLELKVANERLQRQLVDLRVLDPSPSAPLSAPPTSPVYSLGPSSLSLPSASSVPLHPPDASSVLSSQRLSYDDFGSSATQLQNPLYETLGLHTYGAQCLPASDTRLPDEDDETSRRKKTRKLQNAEQYVCITCGRTDSPEWRKGPQGPKTLCNACGLRWAKEVRSNENAAAGPSTSGHNA